MSKLDQILDFQQVGEILRIIDDAPRGGEVHIQLGDASLQLKMRGTGEVIQTSAPQPPASPAEAPRAKSAEPAVDSSPTEKTPLPPGGSLSPEEAESQGLVLVASPMAGIFYRSPAPGEAPFVEVGDEVEEGQQLGIIEVMKLMNRIAAPCAGTVREIALGNEDLA